jgi:hypothetical protein
MDLGPLRPLARALSLSAFGVPATVTLPNDLPVETTGIWVQSLEETQPFGQDLGRREPRKVLAIPRTTALPVVPRGSLIVAAELSGESARTWRVDGLDRVEVDLVRVILVPVVSP